MGARFTRSASSSAFGGGRAPSSQTDRNSRGKNRAPVAAGIQKGVTWTARMSHAPTDFTTPEERMKLAQRIEPSTSETRRPSM